MTLTTRHGAGSSGDVCVTVVVHGSSHPTIEAFLDWAGSLGLEIVRMVAYRGVDGVRGSVMGSRRS